MEKLDNKKKKMKKRKKITLIVVFSIVGFVILNVLGEVIATPFIYNAIFPRVDIPDYNLTPGLVNYNDIKDTYPRNDVTFKSGDNNLTAHIYEVSSPKGLVIFSHGMKSGADSYLSSEIYFVDHGYSVFTYNSTGTYSSEGDSLIGFPQAVIDLQHALDYVNTISSLSSLKKCLIGHSWGGYAVTEILNFDYNIAAVASISGANDAEQIVINSAKDTVGDFLATLGQPFVITYQRIKFGDYSSLKAVDGINKKPTKVLIAHGKEDTRFPIERDSIYSHKSEISNPNVIYYLGEGTFSGHSSILYSQDANDYQELLSQQYQALLDDKKELTYEEQKAFYDTIDDSLYSQINPTLFSNIITMFNEA
jgi:dienelactone hydrolase